MEEQKLLAVTKIRDAARVLDVSNEPAVRNVRDFRKWIIRNYSKLGIEKILLVRPSNAKEQMADFKIKIGDVELEMAVVIKSRQYARDHPRWRKKADILIATIINHEEVYVPEVIMVPMNYIDLRLENRRQKRKVVESVSIPKTTLSELQELCPSDSYNDSLLILIDELRKRRLRELQENESQ